MDSRNILGNLFGPLSVAERTKRGETARAQHDRHLAHIGELYGLGALRAGQRPVTANTFEQQQREQLARLRAQQQLGDMGITYVDRNMSIEDQLRQVDIQQKQTQVDLGRMKDKADRERAADGLREAKERQRIAKYKEEEAIRYAEAERELEIRRLRDTALYRRAERRSQFKTPWNLFRVWFWGLMGVSSYETIRDIKLRERDGSLVSRLMQFIDNAVQEARDH